MAALSLPPLGAPDPAGWVAALGACQYGALPPPPEALEVETQPLPGDDAERLVIHLRHGGRRFSPDAALWLPPQPKALLVGLEFAGPIGVLTGRGFPLDPNAIAYSRPEMGAPDGRLTDTLRGTAQHRWPIPLLMRAGYAVLISGYGSWTPDDPEGWALHGTAVLMGVEPEATGAISLWAWAYARLIDAARKFPALETIPVSVMGFSRLGKAALWAAAQDARIGTVFANASGCAGAAPHATPGGETLAQLTARFPHWLRASARGADPAGWPVDQPHLLGALAPRRVYLGNAMGDDWADPFGTLAALRSVAPLFGADPAAFSDTAFRSGQPIHSGPLGTHLRPGAHETLPLDWHHFLRFAAQ